ncbi:MAG: hypothetical protein ABSF95_00445 [Verrucomicrobiota bacterium]|jgi:hypothetical protein
MKPKIFRTVKRAIEVSDIQPGPKIHRRLSTELEERIRKLEAVFAQAHPMSHAEWVDGLQRDLNPESEVRIWEAMASAYQSLLAKHALSLPAKKEAVGLMAAGNPDASGRYLTKSQAKELMMLYSEALAKNRQTPPLS